MGEQVLNRFALRAINDESRFFPQVIIKEGNPLAALARGHARKQGLYEEERSKQFIQGMDEVDDEFEDEE
jgi:hypothetical protein